MKNEQIDATDLDILRTVQQDGRLTIKEIAQRVNLSTTPVFERLKRLEASGYIRRYVAVLDAEKLGKGFVVFCRVKLRRMNGEIARDFVQRVGEIPEVVECYNISGDYDYLLKIHAPDMRAYQEFLINVLGGVESLGSVESSFVMAEVKHEHGISI